MNKIRDVIEPLFYFRSYESTVINKFILAVCPSKALLVSSL